MAAFNTFPGNESEKTNMLPTIRRVKRNLDINRIIVVADRGLNTSDNTALLSGKNNDEMEQKDLIENPRNYTRSSSYGAAGYVENIKFCKDTGSVADGQNLSLNTKKIEEEEKYDGYYSIVTSEKDMPDSEIRNIYKGLWEIEESFKIIKSEFKARPVYVKTETHINAHFLICFVALVIMRVMEHMTEDRYTTKEIRNSLINYACSYLEQNYYLFDYRDRVIDDFSRKYGWNLSQKYMSQATIKNILKHRKKE